LRAHKTIKYNSQKKNKGLGDSMSVSVDLWDGIAIGIVGGALAGLTVWLVQLFARAYKLT
jgi:nitrate reductase NapE component